MNRTDATAIASGDTKAGFTSGVKANRVAKPLTPQFVAKLLLVGDITGFVLCYGLVSMVLTDSRFLSLLTSKRLATLVVITVTCLWLVDAFQFDSDERLWRPVARFLGGLALAGCIFAVGIYLLGPELLGGNYNFFGRRTLTLGALTFACWGTLLRIQVRKFQSRRVLEARWLLLGSQNGKGLTTFWRDFQTERGHGSLVLLTEPGAGWSAQPADLPEIAGDWNGLEKMLQEPWSGIIVASAMPETVVRTLMHARLDGMRVRTIEEFCDTHWQRVPVEYLQGEWFAFANGFALLESPVQAKIKRASDMALAAILFLVAGLPMILMAAVLKAFYHGPVLYTQPRVGRSGHIFTCYKFCTMRRVPNAESADCEQLLTCADTCTNCDDTSGPLGLYTTTNDARITGLGRLMRKTRFDELPQLWNVLRGDMSFIGPRAEWTMCVAEYEDVIPFYHLRHLVRPGLTGWAQVNYPYGASVEDARIKLTYDIWYIKNHNLFLDMLIVLRTIRVVLFRIGAR